jgi:putative MATE family efflux protein
MTDSDNSNKTESRPKKDWTQGPILGNLLHLSWPMVVMETLFVISQVVDMIWIGKLGSTAVAGAGIANIIVMLVMSADFGIIAGVRAMISRHIGAKDLPNAQHVAGQAILISAAWGTLITLTGFFLAGPLMRMFGMEAEVVSQGMSYMRVMFSGWIGMELLVMGLYIIQSSGDTLNPMRVELSIRILHVTLCPFLVLGLWIFPPMGVAGAALSNVISQGLGALIILVFLFSGRTRIKIGKKDFKLAPDLIRRILKIGVPALVMNLQRNVGNMVLMWFFTPFGTLAVAAHSLASRVEMFIYMPSMGLGSGAGVLVGQNLGAHKPERAEKSVWLAVVVLEVFMLVCGTAILLFANAIMGFFSSDPALIKIGAVFLRIAVAGYLVLALTTVLQNCLSGAGDTLPNMIISLAMIWVVQIPLAFLLPRIAGLDVYGIRWAIVASNFAACVATISYFRLGRWKTKKV